MKKTKTKLLTMGLAAMMTLPGYTSEKVDTIKTETKKPKIVKVTKGSSQLSIGLSENDSLLRFITNTDVSFAGLNASYKSFNQINDLDTNKYFGIHRFGLGLEKTKTILHPTLRVITNSEGILDSKIGFETNKTINLYAGDNKLIELLDPDYGFSGLYTDGKNHTANILFGHNLDPLSELT